MNFRLKHFCISRDTNKIALHVIKQYLQAVHHLLLVRRLHQNVTVGLIISQLINRKSAK